MQDFSFKYPTEYNETAILLYLISMEVANLMREIRAQSPVASKKLAPQAVFTSGQIEEARNHVSGFIGRAITTLAKRQMGLNVAMLRLEQLKKISADIENGFALAMENPKQIKPEEIVYLEGVLRTLKDKEKIVDDITNALHNMAKNINRLIADHSSEWEQHRHKYAPLLITELEKNEVLLSELEKQELYDVTRTIDEVRQNLKDCGIFKEEKKKRWGRKGNN